MEKRIERINARPEKAGMVGDGFRVYNYFPHGGFEAKQISPFLLLDFNAEYHFSSTEKPRGVGAHPHKGFETVTIAYKGSVAHEDSTGNKGVIRPGDVQWMTAGAGILHKEFHEQEYARSGGPFEMVQLWVNLPKKDKSTPPKYQALTASQMDKIPLANNSGEVRVIAGEFNEVKGPAETFTPINLFNIHLKKEGTLSFDIPETHNAGMLVVNGQAVVNGQTTDEHSFLLFSHEGTGIDIKADKDSVLLFLSGEPINEPVAQYGPFVMNTQKELYEAIEEYQAGKFGVLH